MTKEEVLKQCTIEGMVVKLPNTQLDRKVYQEVNKAIQLIGGQWKGGKIAGFVFQEDPTDLLEQLKGGEQRNLKKEFQFFSTPSELADYLVELAEIKSTDSILEPSAGQGAIVDAIHRVEHDIVVDCCELMELNQTFLKKRANLNLLCSDFFGLSAISKMKYDKIIANPPFSKNQDIDHVREMFKHLAKGGRIVTVTSKHWQISNNKKEREFSDFLEHQDAQILEVEGGAFKDSGTMIASLIVIIDK